MTETPYIMPILMGARGTPLSWGEFQLRYSAVIGGTYYGEISDSCRGGDALPAGELHSLGFCAAAAQLKRNMPMLLLHRGYPSSIDEAKQ